MLHTHPHLETLLGLDDSHVIVDRAEFERAVRPIVLSQRNLLTLLYHIVTGNQGPLRKPGGPMLFAESDKAHYFNRSAGPMSPETEVFIRRMSEAALDARTQLQDAQNPPTWAVKIAKALAQEAGDCYPTLYCDSCDKINSTARLIAETLRREYQPSQAEVDDARGGY